MGRFQLRRSLRHLSGGVALLGTIALGACGGDKPTAGAWSPDVSGGLTSRTVQGVGLRNPQSVLYDATSDVYLVSNADGGALDRDGSGFVSRISPKGEVESLRWIDGRREGVVLDAPKGMALRGDTLYVADIDCVRLFRRATGAPVGSVCPQGATSLADVAVDQDGLVYVTDRGGDGTPGSTGAVYTIDAEGAASMATGAKGLREPLGISASDRGVFVAGQGGRVVQLTPDGPRGVVKSRSWRLGGIVFTRDGSFLFSNWADSTVLFVRAKEGGSKGDVFTLVRGIPSPGDLGYDARRDRVMIPLPSLDRLLLIDLEG